MDRGAWRTTVHGAAKGQTWLSTRLHAHTPIGVPRSSWLHNQSQELKRPDYRFILLYRLITTDYKNSVYRPAETW